MKSLIEYINESNNIELVSDGKEHGYDYVDLGLPSGTMWATCNVGATKPEDYGLLFQFGRVDGYKYWDGDNYFRSDYQNINDTGCEYTPQTTSGKVYKAGDKLDLKDDAANVNMGGVWKMPTETQLKELFNQTTRENETVNGIKGMMFTSKKNGKQLFIPFGGNWYGDFDALGSWFNMWSSQVHESDPDIAYNLQCGANRSCSVVLQNRVYAYSVRGVFKK